MIDLTDKVYLRDYHIREHHKNITGTTSFKIDAVPDAVADDYDVKRYLDVINKCVVDAFNGNNVTQVSLPWTTFIDEWVAEGGGSAGFTLLANETAGTADIVVTNVFPTKQGLDYNINYTIT